MPALNVQLVIERRIKSSIFEQGGTDSLSFEIEHVGEHIILKFHRLLGIFRILEIDVIQGIFIRLNEMIFEGVRLSVMVLRNTVFPIIGENHFLNSWL